MPAPLTIVTLTDDDGDEFPISLPGVHLSKTWPPCHADVEAALQIAAEMIESGDITPNGTLKFDSIEYR